MVPIFSSNYLRLTQRANYQVGAGKGGEGLESPIHLLSPRIGSLVLSARCHGAHRPTRAEQHCPLAGNPCYIFHNPENGHRYLIPCGESLSEKH